MRAISLIVFSFWFIAIPALAQPPAPMQAQPKEADLLYTPDHSVQMALTDLRTMPPDLYTSMRYISLYNVPKKDRAAVAATVSFVVNSLSTRKKMYIPSFVPNSNDTLIRINLDDYDWDHKTWDKLGRDGSGPKAFPEPYFHFFVELQNVELVVGQSIIEIVSNSPIVDANSKQIGNVLAGEQFVIKKADGDWYSITTRTGVTAWIKKTSCRLVQGGKKVGNKTLRHAQAPWLDTTSISQLVSVCNTEYPIFRADWFISNAILPPLYYDFLKLGNNFKDFEKLIFSDVTKAEQAKLQDKGIVLHSSVARNNRTLTRSNTLTNYIWVSKDTLKSVGTRKYAQILLNEEFDASEIIGALPNGLQAYFLTDGKGVRIDAADVNVAIDSTSVDKVVRTGRSCMICHSDGIRPIDDEIRSITQQMKNREQVKLLATNKDDSYKIEDLFGSDLNDIVLRDQMAYQKAINACTGLDMRVNASNLARIYDDYAETVLSKEVISRECGLTPMELEKYIRSSTDNVLLGLIKGRIVRRDQWEESYGNFMIMVTAIKKANQNLPPAPQ